ncbi:MAG: TetR/AcrR family transcriptional regulator [Acidimicrobiales bacterium]|nr:TetR/AcrR family transcriptional regulator [Acidimicrobiales bacterium]HRW36741.1 helix-turn-helix domain-containing protein [Aquihabitans sp.]
MASPTAEPVLTRGHKKKARTRRLLLDTALEVLAEQGEGFAVADLAARAGMSHGTFYNHFADREELIAALAPEVVAAFAAQAAAEVDEPDPARRFAAISARVLARAAEAPEMVRVALRLEAVQQALIAEGSFAPLRDDLASGHASGAFAEPPTAATLDVVVGSLLIAARRIVDGERGAAYREGVLRHLLRSLGVGDDAEAIAAEAVAAAGPPT